MNQIIQNFVLGKSKYLSVNAKKPVVHNSCAIRNSIIEGDVTLEEGVHVVNAVLRADEGTPFYICKNVNIQDFVILHSYSNYKQGEINPERMVEVEGKGRFAIFVDENASLSHGVLVHGPAYIGKNTFVGFKATIDAANIGKDVEIGAHSYIKGIDIPDGVAVKPNSVILTPQDLQASIIPRTGINTVISDVNIELCEAYKNIYNEAAKQEA